MGGIEAWLGVFFKNKRYPISLSFSVGFSIQDEAMDVAQSAPQGAHYHAEVIYLFL